MSGAPNSETTTSTSKDDTEHLRQREMEQLAEGVSEMVLKSPPILTEKSKLSVNAPEFVPSWINSAATKPTQQAPMNANHSITTPLANNSFDTQPQAPQVNSMTDAEISQYLLSDIRMYVTHLRTSPDSFNDIAITILDLITNFAFDNKILAAIVDTIFRAGLEFENFSYQCARLCGFLAANYWGYGGAHPSGVESQTASFRDLLLKRCREEHQNRLQGPLPCIYNYGLLLADLYNQVKIEERSIEILGDAVIAVVSALLTQPNDGNVACAVRILKCCGSTLEYNERSITVVDHKRQHPKSISYSKISNIYKLSHPALTVLEYRKMARS
jgi:hypothetical protein